MYSASLLGLKVFSNLYSIYKVIKRNTVYRYGSIAGLVLFLVFLFLFGGSKSGPSLSPFDVLGVTKDMTRKEIGRVHRKLSAQYHPDKNPNDPSAQTKYIQIQKAYEILNDAKKLENWEKYGNPNGPDAQYYEDKYPDFIVNPPRSFVFIIISLFFVAMALPLCLFIIPLLKSPPQVFCDAVEQDIKYGEKLLGEHKKEAIAELTKGLNHWKSLVKTFPRYESSIYQTIYHFRVAARIAQYKIYEGDVDGANNDLQECKKFVNADHLKSKEVKVHVVPIINNLLDTVESCSLPKNKDSYIRSVISYFKK